MIGILAGTGSLQAAPAADRSGPNSLAGSALESESAKFAPGEVLVKFKPGVDALRAETAVGRLGGAVRQRLQNLDIRRVTVPKGLERKVIDALRADPSVEFAEPNYVRRIAMAPNDPLYPSQSDLTQINAPQAWDLTTGSADVTIAVVDTGVSLNHPDLAGKILAGASFVSGITSADDDNGHGTHVAGIAAAIGNNGIGIAGVSWGAKILPVKVLDSWGNGTDYDVAQGIAWAADQGAKVINLSLGGVNVGSVLQEAVSYAQSKGALVVAAAGNCAQGGIGCDYSINPVFYPAAYPGVLAVGAVNAANQKSSFSEYGNFVDVVAPGESICSTVLSGKFSCALSGTSQATPHVSGLAALIWSRNPSLTADQVANIIEMTATDLGSFGRDDYYGYGLVNALAAVQASTSMVLSPGSMSFMGDATRSTATRYLDITNLASQPISWMLISAVPSWLSLSKTSGTIPVGADDKVIVGALGVGLGTTGTYTSTLTIASYEGGAFLNAAPVYITFDRVDQLPIQYYFPILFQSLAGG